MEEDIENALNNLWNSLDDESFNLTYSQEQMQEDLRLILNRYNYLDSKAENLINKNKELETMIELMADRLTHYRISDDGVNTRLATREEKIEWFRKKAR